MLNHAQFLRSLLRVLLALTLAETISAIQCPIVSTSGVQPALISACAALSSELKAAGTRGGTFVTYVTFPPITYYVITRSDGSVYTTTPGTSNQISATLSQSTGTTVRRTSSGGAAATATPGTGISASRTNLAAGTTVTRAAASTVAVETASPSSNNNNYTNHVIIPVAVVCTVVPVLLFLALCWYCLRRKRKHRKQAQEGGYLAGAERKDTNGLSLKSSDHPPVLPMIGSTWYHSEDNGQRKDDASSVYEADGDEHQPEVVPTQVYSWQGANLQNHTPRHIDSRTRIPGEHGAQDRGLQQSGVADRQAMPHGISNQGTPTRGPQTSGKLIPSQSVPIASPEPPQAVVTSTNQIAPSQGFSRANQVPPRQDIPARSTSNALTGSEGAIAGGVVAGSALAGGAAAAGALTRRSEDQVPDDPNLHRQTIIHRPATGEGSAYTQTVVPTQDRIGDTTAILPSKDRPSHEFPPQGTTEVPRQSVDQDSQDYAQSVTTGTEGEFVTPMTSQLVFGGQTSSNQDPRGMGNAYDYGAGDDSVHAMAGANEEPPGGTTTPRRSYESHLETGGTNTPDGHTISMATEQRFSVPLHPPRRSSKRTPSGGAGGTGRGGTMPGSWFDSTVSTESTYDGFDFGFQGGAAAGTSEVSVPAVPGRSSAMSNATVKPGRYDIGGVDDILK